MVLKENCIKKEKLLKGKNRYYLYVFNCIKCNKEIKIQGGSLKTHSGKCGRCSQLKEPYKFIYNELRVHKKNNITVDLTFDEFLGIINIKKCHYCGKDLIYNKHSRYWGKTNSRAHQLDRKNNNLSYTKDNVVCCCWDCNRLKSDYFTYDEFMMLSSTLKKIQKNRNKL